MLTKHRDRCGSVLETWVYGELRKNLALSDECWFLGYYRDKDQVEVDFVLESPLREVIGLEVKAVPRWLPPISGGCDGSKSTQARTSSQASFSMTVTSPCLSAMACGQSLWRRCEFSTNHSPGP